MKTRAAILTGTGKDWEIEEVDLGSPVSGEVRVQLVAAGLCHSDHHLRTGATPSGVWPVLGGHEGAGVIVEVGPGVTDLAVGDHVILLFIPACGTCGMCSQGLQNLCDKAARGASGRAIADDTHRITLRGEPVMPMCMLGAFSPYVTVNQASVVKIADDIPLEVGALLGCGATTGWGSATTIGAAKVGDTVVVAGVGGVGIYAIQGAAAAGARHVVAVDPVEFKRRTALDFGATHAFASLEEAGEAVFELTSGAMADLTILAMGSIRGEVIQPALAVTGKARQVVIAALGERDDTEVTMSLFELTLLQKRVQGAIFGGTSPRTQIPQLLDSYRSGTLKLEEMITREYSLDEINQGYEDLLSGKNMRGIIRFSANDY